VCVCVCQKQKVIDSLYYLLGELKL